MRAFFSLKHSKKQLGETYTGFPNQTIAIQCGWIVLNLDHRGIFFNEEGFFFSANPVKFHLQWPYRNLPSEAIVNFIQE